MRCYRAKRERRTGLATFEEAQDAIFEIVKDCEWHSSREIHDKLRKRLSDPMFGRVKKELGIEHRRVGGGQVCDRSAVEHASLLPRVGRPATARSRSGPRARAAGRRHRPRRAGRDSRRRDLRDRAHTVTLASSIIDHKQPGCGLRRGTERDRRSHPLTPRSHPAR